MFFRSFLSAAVIAASLTCAVAADISGAGATFPFPIYAKWADSYKKDTGDGLNYQSIGSGAGVKQIKAKTVTFGATDAPLTPDELTKAGLAQFPMVMGGIVLVVNLEGVKPGELVLDGPTVAQIYLGKITNWNDPAIKKLNPNVNLPNLAIASVHRADGSGTTFNFTNYLSKVSPEWKDKIGEATTVEWPGGIGAKGNDGVANNVATTKGAIGYVEFAYADQNKLTFTSLINQAGKTVAPTMESFQAAAANADWANSLGVEAAEHGVGETGGEAGGDGALRHHGGRRVDLVRHVLRDQRHQRRRWDGPHYYRSSSQHRKLRLEWECLMAPRPRSWECWKNRTCRGW